MNARAIRILVVEDEPKVARALEQGLAAEGYAVSLARTGENGFFKATSELPDLVILDRMLPGFDGLKILEELRKREIRMPVLILTALDGVDDRVRGLDLGADDYLVKPFAFPELLARVRALLRRGRSEPEPLLRAGDVQLDASRRRVARQGREVELTPREFDLLEYLLRHNGRVVSREMLARDVWHETVRATPLDNVIDVHVMRLRRKLDPDLIRTVRGVGFLVREEQG